MATPKIVPRATGEGSLGDAAYGWGGAFVTNTTTSSASQGGKLVLAADDGAVMASGHRLGVIEFKGAEDTGHTLTIGARIEALTDDTWSASENGASLKFYTTDANASESLVLTLNSDKLATFAGAVSIDSVSISAIQTSSESFADNDTSLMTSAAIDDRINTAVATEDTFEELNDTAIDTITAGNILVWNGSTSTWNNSMLVASTGLTLSLAVTGTNTLVTDANQGHVTTVGALNAGSITSGFTSIDVGAGAISTTGALTGGTVTGLNYRTIYVDAGSMVPAVTNGAQAGTEETGTSTAMNDYFAFDTSTDEHVWFKLAMPEQYDGGTVKFKAYWRPKTGTNTDYSVTWNFLSIAHDDGDDIATALSLANIVVINDNVLGTAATKLHTTAATPAHTIAGVSAGSNDQLVWFRVGRDVSADDLGEDAYLLGVAIQYRESTTADAAW
jgi:hypothetical protein